MIDTPICLDESITGPLIARQALEIGACGFINIKPARVGGLAHSLEINRMCRQAGVGCWVGGMMESDVGKSICVELAAVDNMIYPHDITPEKDNYPDPSENGLCPMRPPGECRQRRTAARPSSRICKKC
jgi:L-alanine-DL-glutamate epimerase and related enzymes of enolase superfamily